MELIDTHCHLYLEGDKQYSDSAEAVVNRAKTAGVKQLILIGTDEFDNRQNIEFAQNTDGIYCAVGFHPSELDQNYIDLVEKTRILLANKKVVAIGEVGLDTSYGGDLKNQVQFLEEMIKLTIEFEKPLILHIRNVWNEAYELLSQHKGKINAVFHCFTANWTMAQKLLDGGWMLSFTNIISYPKNDQLREVVKNTPIEKIMVETDAPFLPPQNRRGTICEPADVVSVAQEIAKIKGILVENVAEITTKNAIDFFNL